MGEKITSKTLRKQKDKIEKLMAVFGEEYNQWLYEKHEEYISENSEKAFDALFQLKEQVNDEAAATRVTELAGGRYND